MQIVRQSLDMAAEHVSHEENETFFALLFAIAILCLGNRFARQPDVDTRRTRVAITHKVYPCMQKVDSRRRMRRWNDMKFGKSFWR